MEAAADRKIVRASTVSEISQDDMREAKAFIIGGRHYNRRDADFRLEVLGELRERVKCFDIFEEIPRSHSNVEFFSALRNRSRKQVSAMARSYLFAPTDFLEPMLLEYKRLAERNGARIYPIGNPLKRGSEHGIEFSQAAKDIKEAEIESARHNDYESRIPSLVKYLRAAGRLAELDNSALMQNINGIAIELNIPFVVSIGTNHADHIAANLKVDGNVVVIVQETLRALQDFFQEAVAIARRGGPENVQERLVLAKQEAGDIAVQNDNIGAEYIRSLMNAKTLLGVEALASEMRSIQQSTGNPHVDMERALSDIIGLSK